MNVWVLNVPVNYQNHCFMVSFKQFFLPTYMRGENKLLGLFVSAFCFLLDLVESECKCFQQCIFLKSECIDELEKRSSVSTSKYGRLTA